MIYRPNAKMPAEDAEFIVQNSKRTVFLQKNSGDVVLAHLNQVKSVNEAVQDTEDIDEACAKDMEDVEKMDDVDE